MPSLSPSLAEWRRPAAPRRPDARLKACNLRSAYRHWPSARDAHQRLPAPSVIRAARRRWPRCRRALVANGKRLLPSIADTAAPWRDAATDTASARSRCRFAKSTHKQAGSDADKADHRRGSSLARVPRSTSASWISFQPAKKARGAKAGRTGSRRGLRAPIEKDLKMGGGAASRAKRPLNARYSGGTSCHPRACSHAISVFGTRNETRKLRLLVKLGAERAAPIWNSNRGRFFGVWRLVPRGCIRRA